MNLKQQGGARLEKDRAARFGRGETNPESDEPKRLMAI